MIVCKDCCEHSEESGLGETCPKCMSSRIMNVAEFLEYELDSVGSIEDEREEINRGARALRNSWGYK